jgi:hypothetical protein
MPLNEQGTVLNNTGLTLDLVLAELEKSGQSSLPTGSEQLLAAHDIPVATYPDPSPLGPSTNPNDGAANDELNVFTMDEDQERTQSDETIIAQLLAMHGEPPGYEAPLPGEGV